MLFHENQTTPSIWEGVIFLSVMPTHVGVPIGLERSLYPG